MQKKTKKIKIKKKERKKERKQRVVCVCGGFAPTLFLLFVFMGESSSFFEIDCLLLLGLIEEMGDDRLQRENRKRVDYK